MKWNCRMNASEGNVCEAVREANSKTVVELIYCITSLLILAPFFFFFCHQRGRTSSISSESMANNQASVLAVCAACIR